MIRTPKADDLAALVELGRAFHAEAGYADLVPFCHLSFGVTLTTLYAADLLLVVEHNGKVVGMAAADVAPFIFNRSVLLSRECFWYVEPSFRKGIGRKLLPALEALVKSRGASTFDVVAESGKRSDALARVYRAGGFSPSENTFRKWLKPCLPDQSLVA